MLSAVIISQGESPKLTRAQDSLSFADEVLLILDGEGDSKHPKYFRKLAADFAGQRNFALTKTSHEWVLFIDDDEVVTDDLKKEISKRINKSKSQGFYLRRLDNYYGQTLKFGETGDIRLLRLGRRGAGVFIRPVHEIWNIKGRTGFLRSPLIHYREDLVGGFQKRISLYGPIDAKALSTENKPYSPFKLLTYPLAKFIRNYIIKRGFLDGHLGLFHAYLMSLQSLSVRVFQWEEKSLP